MSILSLNISAAVMITMTLFIRKIFKNHIPHSVFCVLWAVIILRLFIPVSIDSDFSFWNFCMGVEESIADVTGANNLASYVPVIDYIQNGYTPSSVLTKLIWGFICAVLGIYFLCQYLKLAKEMKNAAPIEDECLNRQINALKLHRDITIKKINGLDSPATLGVISPVIFFPIALISAAESLPNAYCCMSADI